MKNLYPYPIELCRQAIYRHRKYLERLRTPLDSPQSRHLPPKFPLSLQTPRDSMSGSFSDSVEALKRDFSL
jgi:hypothetical protein